jgi:hypothetical protein
MPVPHTFNAVGRSVIRGIRVACMIQAALACGCMTPSTPPRTAVTENTAPDNTSVQSGKILVGPHQFPDVYYNPPFAAPPVLEITDHWGSCKIVIPTATHFRVLNSSNSDLVVEWKAHGPKAVPVVAPALGPPQGRPTPPALSPAPAVAAPPAPPTPPVGGLPSEPVPVTSSR